MVTQIRRIEITITYLGCSSFLYAGYGTIIVNECTQIPPEI
jgi:hypothetical protein